MGGWRYVSCFIWDHNLYRVWHHITPRATGCMVFGCMEGKTKNPTSNNSDKRWETGAQFLFCCLTFCCLMFLEFSQWHVLWKKDMTCIFQICMCTAVEWSAICLPWVSPSAYGASQLLGFGNRFVENWKVMRNWKNPAVQPQWFRTFMSIAICLEYRYCKWRSWKQSHLPIKIAPILLPKTCSKYIKVVGIRGANNGNQVFFYQDTRTKDKSMWKVCGGDFSTGCCSFFHFNSPMMKWNNIIWGFTLDALADRGNWKSLDFECWGVDMATARCRSEQEM